MADIIPRKLSRVVTLVLPSKRHAR